MLKVWPHHCEMSIISFYHNTTVQHSNDLNVVVLLAARSLPLSCQVATGYGSALTLTVSVRLVFIVI